jgi:hypothetical protein
MIELSIFPDNGFLTDHLPLHFFELVFLTKTSFFEFIKALYHVYLFGVENLHYIDALFFEILYCVIGLLKPARFGF